MPEYRTRLLSCNLHNYHIIPLYIKREQLSNNHIEWWHQHLPNLIVQTATTKESSFGLMSPLLVVNRGKWPELSPSLVDGCILCLYASWDLFCTSYLRFFHKMLLFQHYPTVPPYVILFLGSWSQCHCHLSFYKCCFVSYNVPASKLEHLGPPDAGEPKLEVNFWAACLAPGSKCPNLDIIKSFSVSEWDQRTVIN